MTQKKEERKVRHLGSRWASPAEARLDNLFLRNLFRLGSNTGTGKVAGMMRLKQDDPEFQDTLDRLLGYALVELRSAFHGEAVRVSLTAEGKVYAEEACHTAQIEEQDRARREFEERIEKERGW